MSNWKSPGLEINDMGFMRQADWFINVLWTGYNFTEPFSIFRSLRLNHDIYTVSDFGGNLLNAGYERNFNANLKNFWNAGAGGGYEFLNISNTMLRGGPSMHLPSGWRIWSRVSSDSRKKISVSIRSNVYWKSEDVSKSYSLGASLTIRPENTLRISMSPDYSIRSDEFQYVAQRNYNDQVRYLFGKIDQKVLSMSLRINYIIISDLTIQYWGQPFIATGGYSNFVNHM